MSAAPSFLLVPLLLVSLVPAQAQAQPREHFVIDVRDRASNEPVSGVHLRTTSAVVRVTDANGRAAFYEPGLMGERVWFYVEKPGYTYPADGFGFRGVGLDVVEGGSATLLVDRTEDAPGPDVTHTDETTLAASPVPTAAERFRIAVVDRATGRGVPLVELETGAGHWVTDSNGLVAFHSVRQMGAPVSFSVRSHGYASTTAELTPTPGGAAVIELDRVNIAERLYRVTGQGIYADTVLLGEQAPIAAPVLNGKVTGQDSVQSTLHEGEVFWIWGDTNRPSYPLGNFRASGARSKLPGAGGLPASVGVEFEYFVAADGFSKEMAPNATVPGPGVTWMNGLISVPRAGGGEALYAGYGKFEGLTRVAQGLSRFDPEAEVFTHVLSFDGSLEEVRPENHPFRFGDHVYFYDSVRIPATAEALEDPSTYERFTAFDAKGEVVRSEDGRIVYAWRKRGRQVLPQDVSAGRVTPRELLSGLVVDPDTGELVVVHSNSAVAWSPWAERFVGTFLQSGGTSSLVGEVWHAEADTPMGPWVYARKVITHDRYNFYNPRLHPFFSEEGGRFVFLEGTLTTHFTHGVTRLPRYDYNQLMYRVDLADPRLALPVPVYETAAGALKTRRELSPGDGVVRIAFYAPDRPGYAGSLPVFAPASCADEPLRKDAAGGRHPAFFVLPSPREGMVPLRSQGEEGDVLGYVWPAAGDVVPPVQAFRPPLDVWAGEDQCVRSGAEGLAELQVTATVHPEAGGAQHRHLWEWTDARGAHRVEGQAATLQLPVGSHEVRLTVTDAQGAAASDVVRFEVAAGEANEDEGASCGCSQPGTLGLLGLVLLLGLRRRAAPSTPSRGAATGDCRPCEPR